MSYFPIAVVFFAFSCTAFAGPIEVPVTQQLPLQETFRPYEFGYDFGDEFGMTQQRREVADGTGTVKGNYGYLDPSGIYRRVEYTADANGYKTVIHSNEPGATSHAAADAVYVVELPPPEAVDQGLSAQLSRESVHN